MGFYADGEGLGLWLLLAVLYGNGAGLPPGDCAYPPARTDPAHCRAGSTWPLDPRYADPASARNRPPMPVGLPP